MMEGLWTVVFQGPQGVGGGCVVFRHGHVLGGDSDCYYIGTYRETAGRLTASIAVRDFIPGATTIFGTTGANHNLQVEGELIGNDIVGSAYVIGAPDLKISFRLIYRAGFEGLTNTTSA